MDKLQTIIDIVNDYHPRIQFTHEMEKTIELVFLDLEIIKLNNGNIVINGTQVVHFLVDC